MLRTIYLQNSLSINDRSCLAGRLLFDEFKKISDEILLGHIIVSDEDYDSYKGNLKNVNDVISYSMVNRLNPNFIYIEGGLFANNSGQWKIPRKFAEELGGKGTVIIVADNDINKLREYKDDYQEAFQFFKVNIDYGDGFSPIYGCDLNHYWESESNILCQTDKMVYSSWLSPIYEGVQEILIQRPVLINAYFDIFASCNKDTTGTLRNDVWVDRQYYCPFGSIAKNGFGYVVFLTGWFSNDGYSKNCSDNLKWMSNAAKFLVLDTEKEKSRYLSHIRSPYLLFLSHRSINKSRVRGIAEDIKSRGIGIWFDEDQLVPSDSLVAEINKALDKMTHFVLFWSIDCKDAPWIERELHSAVAKLIEERLPLIIVRLDDFPVPSIVQDIYRIEGLGKSETEIVEIIVKTVENLSRRK